MHWANIGKRILYNLKVAKEQELALHKHDACVFRHVVAAIDGLNMALHAKAKTDPAERVQCQNLPIYSRC